ncbi:MAG: amino acid adenylation domain-containing protein [Chitinophagaceae bacterium]
MSAFFDSILGPFIEQVVKHPERRAWQIDDIYYTYSDFGRRVLAIAARVAHMPGDAIGLYADNEVDTYAAIWAIWLCGKHYVPLLPQAPEVRNESIMEDAGVASCLNSSEMVLWPSYEGALPEGFDLYLNSVHAMDEQKAYVLFTSGSTGTPKGVVIQKGNIAAFVSSCHALGYYVQAHDRILQPFEMTFDLSIMSYLLAFVHGACLFPLPKDTHKITGIVDVLEKQAISITILVPSFLHYIRPYFEELSFPDLRLAIFCGEPLQEAVLNEWSVCCPNAQLDNIYGPTECSVVCCRHTYNAALDDNSRLGIVSLGRPMPGNLLMVQNAMGEAVPDGEAGELVIGGAQVMPGYLNRPTLNESVLFERRVDGQMIRFYKTGDWVIRRSDGRFDFISRIDFQVKVQGHRVELGEVEFHARAVLGEDYILLVQAIQHTREQVELVLFIQAHTPDEYALREALRSRLPHYMIPTQVVSMPQFPMNANGKTDRKALAQAWLNEMNLV